MTPPLGAMEILNERTKLDSVCKCFRGASAETLKGLADGRVGTTASPSAREMP